MKRTIPPLSKPDANGRFPALAYTVPVQSTKSTNATGLVRTPLPELRDPQAALFQRDDPQLALQTRVVILMHICEEVLTTSTACQGAVEHYFIDVVKLQVGQILTQVAA